MDLKTLQDIPPWDWPETTGETLYRVLTDSQAHESDRIVAAELAGNLVVINDKLVVALLQVASSGESEALRSEVAIALGAVLEQGDIDEFDEFSDMPISEATFNQIQATFEQLFADQSIPKLVRRRILEASIRNPRDWHRDAIRNAYATGDREWMLTAVFSMRWVSDFDDQILEALNSPDEEIHGEAVYAAGNWGLAGAWSHVLALAKNHRTPKPLLMAAIAAIGDIRPKDAMPLLEHLSDSDDEDIAEAAKEALSMAMPPEDEDEDEAGKNGWIN